MRQAAISGHRRVMGYIKLLKETGLSYDKIAKRLNEEGHRTRSGVRFQAITVHRIIKRTNIMLDKHEDHNIIDLI